MELFTLGAGTRLHRARRPRAGAGADRLDADDWNGRRAVQLPLRARAARRRAPSASSARRALQLAGLGPALPRPQAATRPSSSTSSGGTSSRRRPTRDTRRSLERLYRTGYQILPVVDGDPPPPGAPTPGRAWSSRPSSTPPACCGRSAAASTRRRGRGSRASPASACSTAERLGLGRRALARHRHLPRPLGGRELRDPAARRSPDKQSAALPAEPTGRSSTGARLLGQPDDPPGDAGRLSFASPTKAMSDADADWKTDALPVPRRQNAPPPADRRVPRPPDLVKDPMARCCNDFSRTELFRRATAEAGPRAARDRSRHAAARRHGPRPAQLPRAAPLGLTLAVYGGAALLPRAFEEGIARAAAAGPAKGAPLRLPRRRRRLALDALLRAATRLPQPSAQARPGRLCGSAVRRGHPPALAPVADAARHPPRRGQGDCSPGHRLRGPRPVAFHVTPLLGGRRDERPAAYGLARPLPRPGRLARQPAPGPLARIPSPARSRDRPDAGRLDRRAGPLPILDTERLGRCRAPAARRDRLARRPADRVATRRSSRRRPLPARRRSCAGSCCRSHRRATSPATRALSRIRRARTTNSHAAWRASRPCSPRAFPFGSSR